MVQSKLWLGNQAPTLWSLVVFSNLVEVITTQKIWEKRKEWNRKRNKTKQIFLFHNSHFVHFKQKVFPDLSESQDGLDLSGKHFQLEFNPQLESTQLQWILKTHTFGLEEPSLSVWLLEETHVTWFISMVLTGLELLHKLIALSILWPSLTTTSCTSGKNKTKKPKQEQLLISFSFFSKYQRKFHWNWIHCWSPLHRWIEPHKF